MSNESQGDPSSHPSSGTTTFADSIKVESVDGTSNCFSIDIPKDWLAPTSMRSSTYMLSGGHATSIILSAARKYLLTHHPTPPQPDPLNIHVQFLRTCVVSTLRLTVTELSIKPRFSVLQVAILAAAAGPGGGRQEWETHLVAIVTQGHLATEEGISLFSNPAIPPDDIPDRERQCREVAPGVKGVAFYAKTVGFAVYNGDRVGLSEKPGEIIQEHWVGFRDGSELDVLSLGLLCDLFWSTPHVAHPDRADLAMLRYPTLCLSIDIKKDPKGVRWLFRRCQSLKVANGRFDTLVYLVDETGDLYAVSKHVSLIIDTSQPKNAMKL